MARINYITNLDINNFSGGWSGMCHHIYEQLSRRFDINLIEKIDPPYFLSDRVLSKLFRVAGFQGIFPAFAHKRLKSIKSLVENKIDENASLNFYHGSTPWLMIKNNRPYACYLDCCFYSYINVYHDKRRFNSAQLDDLFALEADFLGNASCVFFSSRWAMADTVKNYKLKGDNFFVAGLGGALDIQKNPEHQSPPYFLFAGLDFEGKGGDKVVEAFNEISEDFPEYSLKIVGQRPPEKYLSAKNVEYAGMFNKSDSEQLEKLTALFANAYCFVLPTSKDMTPLVLVEASGLGCPVIATDCFGITEIVRHNETGILLNASEPIKMQLVSAMKEMIINKGVREKFARSAPLYIKDHFTWDRTGKIVVDKLFEFIAQ